MTAPLSAQACFLSDEWWLRTVRFWNSLAGLSTTSLHRRVALADCRDAVVHGVKNWSYAFMHGLRDLGYPFVIRCDTLDTVDMACVQKLLADRSLQAFTNLALNPRICPTARAVSCTYWRWFARPAWSTVSFLQLPIPNSQLVCFLRFRMGCHDLPIDVGRRTGVPRHARTCQYCAAGLVADEYHLVFECSGLQRVRDQYTHLFAPAILTMAQFMWQEHILDVVRFIYDCFAVLIGSYTADSEDEDGSSHQPDLAG